MNQTNQRARRFAQRRLGEATVTVIPSARGILFPATSFASLPELRTGVGRLTSDGRVRIDCVATHIQIGECSLIVDTGRWSSSDIARVVLTADAELSPELELQGYRTAGIDRELVTHVVITHGHWEHYTGVCLDDAASELTFPRARHFLSRIDWDEPAYAYADQERLHRWFRPVIESGSLELFTISSNYDIAPGVRLIPTPGHTPGHVCVRVESDGFAFYGLGDLFHIPEQIEQVEWVQAGNDRERLIASRRAILADAADTDALVVFTHGVMPAWGHVSRRGSGFRWRAVESWHLES